MHHNISRRSWMKAVPGMPLATGILLGLPSASVFAEDAPTPAQSNRPSSFPRQEANLVRDVVGASHRDEAKVRELVGARPALVNAWWDWGFGDWESPLGAAAHTGRRNIAEFLLQHGARIDIFAAAMLGMTDVVEAFVKAQPGVQRTLGPHGITLLAHAVAGGSKAAKTVTYLKSLGDADQGLKFVELDADQKAIYIGEYGVEHGPEHFEIKLSRTEQLTIDIKRTAEPAPRRMFYLGDNEFFPSGVPSVRLRFDVHNGKAQALTIRDGQLVVKAMRAKG